MKQSAEHRKFGRLGILSGAVTAALFLTAAPVTSNEIFSIGTHPIGASYHGMGVGLAKVLSEKTKHRFIVKPYAGTNAWMPLLDSGEVQFASINGLDVAWAYAGEVGFDKPYRGFRLVVQGNLPIVTIGVRRDSGIEKLADLRGKRVASNYGGNQVISRYFDNYLYSAKMSWDDVKATPVPDIVSGMRALRESRVDAAFFGDPNNPASLEAHSAVGLRALDFADLSPEKIDQIPPSVMANLKKTLPSASIVKGRKGHGILDRDVSLVQVSIYFAANQKVSTDTVYEITKALFENDKELQPHHPWLRTWKAETMINEDPPAPYHEGAIRYFKEIGKWTPVLEANQKKLLEGS